jgi:putative addiction module component (TIGR02574 family)
MAESSKLSDFDDLSVAEKILRLQDLWDGIVAEADEVDLTDAQRAELTRRLKEYRDGVAKSSPWAEARQRIRASK